MTPVVRKRRLPKLPTEAFSLLGPVPVTECDELVDKQEALGLTDFRPRTITVDSESGSETKWQTFGHEMTHIAIWDGAVHQQLTDQQLEMVCDCMGTYIAAAVKAGYMKITVPKESK